MYNARSVNVNNNPVDEWWSGEDSKFYVRHTYTCIMISGWCDAVTPKVGGSRTRRHIDEDGH